MTLDSDRRDRARALRRAATAAERMLWSRLRSRRLSEFKFRRQVPVGPFFADFACIGCKVIVEVDGDIHEAQTVQDAARSEFLTDDGWAILRFWNTQIYDDIERVMIAIERTCRERALNELGNGHAHDPIR